MQPETQVLILTVSDDDDHVYEMLSLGARGYILKGATGDELILAIQMLSRGIQYVTPDLAARMLREVGNNKRMEVTPPVAMLSEREQAIANLVGDGLSNKNVAERLQLSEKTVKHYLTNIFRKTHSTNRAALAHWVLTKTVTRKHD